MLREKDVEKEKHLNTTVQYLNGIKQTLKNLPREVQKFQNSAEPLKYKPLKKCTNYRKRDKCNTIK